MAFKKKLLIFYCSFFESAYAMTCEIRVKGIVNDALRVKVF